MPVETPIVVPWWNQWAWLGLGAGALVALVAIALLLRGRTELSK